MHKIANLFFLGLVMPVSAIVVQDYTLAEAEPEGLDWDHVYNYKGSSAVAVGGGWLLTAKHVADDVGDGALTNGTTVYNQQEIVYHPDADLALVHYDKAFPGSYSLYTGALTDPGLEVLMVGFGSTGTVSSNYWTDSGAGRGTKRWGSQIIDRTSIKRYDFTKNTGFLMEFNSTNTTHEAGTGSGDSGGGVFYNEDGVWKLAGINTSVSSTFVSGEFRYSGTFSASMPHYADWIAETIPEPAAIGLMSFSALGLFLSRARRRRKLAGRSLLPIRVDEPMCDLFCTTQEDEAAAKGWINDCQTRMQKMINACRLPAWMNMLHARYKALNKAVWRFVGVAFERSGGRQEAAAERVNKVLVKNLDVFLERISWGRIIISVKSARTKATRALRMGILKSLDSFLDKISWDKMGSLFGRRK